MRSLTCTAGAASGGQPEASGRACQRPSIAQAVLGCNYIVITLEDGGTLHALHDKITLENGATLHALHSEISL